MVSNERPISRQFSCQLVLSVLNWNLLLLLQLLLLLLLQVIVLFIHYESWVRDVGLEKAETDGGTEVWLLTLKGYDSVHPYTVLASITYWTDWRADYAVMTSRHTRKCFLLYKSQCQLVISGTWMNGNLSMSEVPAIIRKGFTVTANVNSTEINGRR